jgi:hypothetical protein
MSVIQMSDFSATSRAHQMNVLVSEGQRQVAAAAASTQAAMSAVDITHYRTCLASAIANKCGTDVFMTALRQLGTTGA